MKEKKEIIKMVRSRLWSNGYSAQDVSSFSDYDVVVNDKIKVAVLYANFKIEKNIVYWLLPNFPLTPKVNVVAIVIETPLKDTLTYYMKLSKHKIDSLIENCLLLEGENGAVLKINVEQLKKLFTDSPKIFTN